MKSRIAYPIRSLCLVVSLVAGPVLAAPITLVGTRIQSVADDASGAHDFNEDFGTSFTSRVLSAADGPSASSTHINWVDTGSGALLDFDFDHVRNDVALGATNAGSLAQSVGLFIDFEVDANESPDYAFTGDYYKIGINGRFILDVSLTNQSTGVVLYREHSESHTTADESFTLDEFGEGATSNNLAGSQSGALVGGDTYRLYFLAHTQALHTPDSGAVATGCVTLSIGGATGGGNCGFALVPAPAPLAMVVLGLALVGVRRRGSAQA